MSLTPQAEPSDPRARLAAHLVSYVTGVAPNDIWSATRGRRGASLARQLAMYLVHTAFSASLHTVGVAFRRDPSTVAHACRIVEERREDPAFDDLVGGLEAMLMKAPKAGLA